MKLEKPSMFRDVPESELLVGKPLGEVAISLIAKIDARRREFHAMQIRNQARIAENEKILREGK